ncbi:MAG: hypothetical protein HPY45_02775 [Anaerolineae bacterium]|nr:hypothetical protein [Anaerolineae bacterium]
MQRGHFSGYLYAAASVLVALALYVFILLNRDEALRQLSISVRYGFTLVLTVVFVVLLAAFWLPGRWAACASFVLTVGLFAFPLAAMWATGAIQSESYTVAGLLPWSDASGYYTDAKWLLEGQRFSSFSSRRPLFAGLLAVLLGISRQNLQAALAMIVFLAAAACYLAAREVRKTHGALLAAFFLTLLFVYYRRYIGTTMTENLGVMLGALGFALLWNGASQRKQQVVLMGILVLTVALNARAGPFFILPALLLWGGLSLGGAHKRVDWRFLFAGAGAVVLGFALNYFVFLGVASPGGAQFSNFSYSLYGLAHGGVHWDQWQYDHPELVFVPEPQHSRTIYQYALAEIQQNPWGLVKGIFKQWGLFFSEKYVIYSVYSFLYQDSTLVGKLARWGLYGLSVLGLLRWYFKRKDLHSGMVAAASIGVLLSVPLVPPGDASRVRVYAAVSPLFVLLPMTGLQFVLEGIKGQRFLQARAENDDRGFLLMGFTGALLLMIVAAPVLTRLLSQPSRFEEIACNPGQELVYVRYSDGAYINVLEDSEPPPDWLPDVRAGHYRTLVHSLPDSKVIEIFEKFEPAFVLMNGMDLRSGHSVWLVINRDLMPGEKGIIGVCGRWGEKEQEKIYWLFYAQAVKLVSKEGG